MRFNVKIIRNSIHLKLIFKMSPTVRISLIYLLLELTKQPINLKLDKNPQNYLPTKP